MGTITKSIGNGCSVSLIKKEIMRSKSNNVAITPSELKSLEKLGIDLTQLVYSDYIRTIKFKYNSYEYIKFNDESIQTFILIINSVIESGNTILDSSLVSLIENANLSQPDTFKFKTSKRLLADVDVVIDGRQTLTLTNKHLDLKLIDMLDEQFILRTTKITGFGETTILVKPDKSIVEFGCRSFRYLELINAINIINEMLSDVDEKDVTSIKV